MRGRFVLAAGWPPGWPREPFHPASEVADAQLCTWRGLARVVRNRSAVTSAMPETMIDFGGVEVEPISRLDGDGQSQAAANSLQPQFLHINPAVEVQYFREKADRGVRLGHRVHCACWLGNGASGAPGFAHGGALAALLEEAMVSRRTPAAR